MTEEERVAFFPCLAQISPAIDACVGQSIFPKTAKLGSFSLEHLWVGRILKYSLVAQLETCAIALMFNMHQTGRKGFLRSGVYGPDQARVDLITIPLSSIRSLQHTILHRCRDLVPGITYLLQLEIVDDVSEGISICGYVGDPAESQTKSVWVAPKQQRWFVPDFAKERVPSSDSVDCVVVGSRQVVDDVAYADILDCVSDFIEAEDVLERWERLLRAEIVLFDSVPDALRSSLDQIIFALHRHGVITFGMKRPADSKRASELCHYGIEIEPDPNGFSSRVYDNVRGKSIGSVSDLSLARCVADAKCRRHPNINLVLLDNFDRNWSAAKSGLRDFTISIQTVSSENLKHGVSTALELGTGEITILLLVPDILDIVHLVRKFVFEHWYPEVGACFGAAVLRSSSKVDLSERDARCLGIRGAAARDCLLETLKVSSGDFASVGALFSKKLAEEGIRQWVMPSIKNFDPILAGIPKKLMHWIRGKVPPSVVLKRKSLSRSRKLRILAYRWHVPHQVELMRLPAHFTLAYGFPQNITEQWPYDQRPLPNNAQFVHFSEIDARDYDLAIVHFDENVLCPELSNGVLHSGWGEPFKWLISLGDLPKIGICHGTPPFKGQYGTLPPDADEFEIDDEQRLKLVRLLNAAGVTVVCNSYQAEQEWKFTASRTIWHGFDPLEFRPRASMHDVLASPLDPTRPHYRGLAKQQQILRKLDQGVSVIHKLKRAPIEVDNTPEFSHRQFWNYARQISGFRIYLNTTLRSPMPRSRGEAMMAGVVPVSLANNDVQMFVRNGVDGFYANDPMEITAFINDAFRSPDALEALRVAARQKAIEVFHIDRFKEDWLRLIKEVIGWAPAPDTVQ